LDDRAPSGDAVPHFSNPLMAKLIVFGEDRPQALTRLRMALDGSRIEGLKHNIPFLQRVLDAQPFIDGNYDVTLTDALLK
ncbi:MAG: biotin carboxylase, partial [Chloroflexi bacterium]|nr:biotin carboxylase [Chloroflexota bacterium]